MSLVYYACNIFSIYLSLLSLLLLLLLLGVKLATCWVVCRHVVVFGRFTAVGQLYVHSRERQFARSQFAS